METKVFVERIINDPIVGDLLKEFGLKSKTYSKINDVLMEIVDKFYEWDKDLDKRDSSNSVFKRVYEFMKEQNPKDNVLVEFAHSVNTIFDLWYQENLSWETLKDIRDENTDWRAAREDPAYAPPETPEEEKYDWAWSQIWNPYKGRGLELEGIVDDWIYTGLDRVKTAYAMSEEENRIMEMEWYELITEIYLIWKYYDL